tara:strand:- start:1583 stop:1939 length:357 start_codon:yes stop_codon:yes gene_type:complete
MILTVVILSWIIAIILVLRFFAVSCKPHDNPFDLLLEEQEDEEEDYLDWEIEECHRCGKENVLSPDASSWFDEGYIHEWEDAIFCERCFYDKGKNGQPYLTDLDEMQQNPYDYLPRGY